MPIIKIQAKSNYAAIPNTTLRDKRLAIESRGVLAYLLTHSDAFEISFEFLQKELDVSEYRLKRIVRELKQAGYLFIEAAHAPDGKFAGHHWFVFAESQEDFSNRTVDRPTGGKTDSRSHRPVVSQPFGYKDLKEKLEKKKNLKKEKLGEKESVSCNKHIAKDVPEPRSLPPDFFYQNFSENEFVGIFAEFYPNQPLKRSDYNTIANRIRDGDAFRRALRYWKENNYRAESIGKICDKYDEILNENGQNYKQIAGNRPNDTDVFREAAEYYAEWQSKLDRRNHAA